MHLWTALTAQCQIRHSKWCCYCSYQFTCLKKSSLLQISDEAKCSVVRLLASWIAMQWPIFLSHSHNSYCSQYRFLGPKYLEKPQVPPSDVAIILCLMEPPCLVPFKYVPGFLDESIFPWYKSSYVDLKIRTERSIHRYRLHTSFHLRPIEPLGRPC